MTRDIPIPSGYSELTNRPFVSGSQFAFHPEFTNATMNVLDATHPSTQGVPQRWHVRDEVYFFDGDPRDLGAVVVLGADDTSFRGGRDYTLEQGSPHPIGMSFSLRTMLSLRLTLSFLIAWYMDKLKGTNSTGLVGRSWYTALGHSNISWKDDTFMSHVLGGVTYVLDSNTTRARNPDAAVGSLGPDYEPPYVPRFLYRPSLVILATCYDPKHILTLCVS
jgi:hypothetical protein